MTRQITITYGSLSMGGASATYIINGINRMSKDYDSFTLSADVIVIGNTNFTTFENEIRTPRQTITVTYGATTVYSLTASSNTGFDAVGTASKPGSEYDSLNSRMYTITLQCSLPADLSGQEGRRDSSVIATYDPIDKLNVTITGTYTALDENSARAQYEASVEAFVTTALSDFSGITFDLIEDRTTVNDTNKQLSFSRVYQEIIYEQAGASSGVDNTAIVNQSIDIRVKEETGERSPLPNGIIIPNIQQVIITYNCQIVKTVTQDLKGTYENTIQPFLLNLADTFLKGPKILLRDEPNYNLDMNTISTALEFQSINSEIMNYRLEVSTTTNEGKSIVTVYHPDPYAAIVLKGAKDSTRRITQTARIKEYNAIPSGGTSSFEGVAKNHALFTATGRFGLPAVGGNERWEQISIDENWTPITYGLDDARQPATDVSVVRTFRRVKLTHTPVAAGGRETISGGRWIPPA